MSTMKVKGNWYYFGYWDGPASEWGKLKSGWITEDYYESGEVVYRDCFYADPNNDCRMVSGWKKINGYWYYFEPRNGYDEEASINYEYGRMYDSGVAEVKGSYYYFPTWENTSKWGKMQTGWIEEKQTYAESNFLQTWSDWYYADPGNDSRLVEGWKKISGKWYYFFGGGDFRMAANCTLEIDGKLWAFNRNGSLHDTKGWVDLYEEYTLDGEKVKKSYWVYTDAKGIAKTFWQKIDGYWYYLGYSGYMYSNEWVEDSGGECWVGSDGKMVSNKWIKDPDDGEWYFIKSDGHKAVNYWAKDSAGWMYLDEDGHITKDYFLSYKDDWYYLKPNGYMATNYWAQVVSSWIYFGSDGKQVFDKWIKYNGEWYYLRDDGYMAAEEWAQDSKGKCWMDENGHITKSEWLHLGEDTYYVGADGYMVTGDQFIDGYWWHFFDDGRLDAKG